MLGGTINANTMTISPGSAQAIKTLALMRRSRQPLSHHTEALFVMIRRQRDKRRWLIDDPRWRNQENQGEATAKLATYLNAASKKLTAKTYSSSRPTAFLSACQLHRQSNPNRTRILRPGTCPSYTGILRIR